VCPECGNAEVEEGEECDDGNDVVWDGCDQCVIAEFQLNYFASGGQTSPDVAVFTSGGFVVAWEVEEEESTDLDVYARLFDAEGQPAGWEFTVNSVVAGTQRNPAVAAWGYGAFVVLWESEDLDGDGYGIFGRLFSPGGTPLGDEFQVNTSADFDQLNPAVTVGKDSNFLVAWQCDGYFTGEPDNFEICARAYGAEPEPGWLGDDFQVNQYKSLNQEAPALAAWDNGDYVAVWEREAGGGANFDVGSRFIGAAGEMPDTGFVVQGLEDGFQWHADVAVADPAFLAVWDSDEAEDGAGACIRGRFYTDKSMFAGGETYVINTTSPGDQVRPSIAAFSSTVNQDEFVVAWQTRPDADTGWELRSQRLDSAGELKDAEFAPHAPNADWDRAQSSLAAFKNGRFMLVWESCPVYWLKEQPETGQDGNACGIFAQRYEPDGVKMYR